MQAVSVKEVIYVNLCHKSYLKREDYLPTTPFYIPCIYTQGAETRFDTTKNYKRIGTLIFGLNQAVGIIFLGYC